MTKEDLFRSMSAIDEDILQRSENAGGKRVKKEVSVPLTERTKRERRKAVDISFYGRWIALAAVLCVGIIIGFAGRTMWVQRGFRQAKPTEVPTPTPDVTRIPTPSATPTPDVTPTGEPSVTPTPDLSDEAIAYGDLSRFVGMKAEDVIAEIGRDYRYEYWGKGRSDGMTAGFTFDDIVYFCLTFPSVRDTLPTACEVSMVEVDDLGKDYPVLDFGGGLHSGMTYSEIRDVVRDELFGPIANSDGTQHRLFGYFEGTNYYFTWSQSPVNNNLPAESIILCDDLSYLPGTRILENALAEYEEQNTAQMNSRREYYLDQLRASFKNVPVTKYALLDTVRLDEYNVVEIYEIAAYGYGASYKTEYDAEGRINSFVYAGTDRSKEAYDYWLAGCLISYGEYMGCYQENDMIWIGFGRLYRSFSRTQDYILEAETLGNLIGIPVDKTNHIVVSAETERYVDEEYYDYSVNVRALYLDNNPTPFCTEDLVSYNGNDGGVYGDHLYVLNEARDKVFTSTQTRSGAYTMDGLDGHWHLLESDSGIKKVEVDVYNEWGNYHFREYLIINDIWILLREGWEA